MTLLGLGPLIVFLLLFIQNSLGSSGSVSSGFVSSSSVASSANIQQGSSTSSADSVLQSSAINTSSGSSAASPAGSSTSAGLTSQSSETSNSAVSSASISSGSSAVSASSVSDGSSVSNISTPPVSASAESSSVAVSANCSTCSTCEQVSYTAYNILSVYSSHGWALPAEYAALATYATMSSWPGTMSFGPSPTASNISQLASEPRPTTLSSASETGSSLPASSTSGQSSSTTHFCSPTYTSIGTDAVSAWCTCSNGNKYSIPTLLHGGWPCPSSAMSEIMTVTRGPVVTQTTSGEAYECFHDRKITDLIAISGGWQSTLTTFTECVGSTSVISTRATPTIRAEVSTGSGVYVGTLGTASATNLHHAVSSAMVKACTSTDKSGLISCPSSATIPHIPYPSSDQENVLHGDLKFGFGGGTVFQNESMLSIMANATGFAAARSVLHTSDNCKIESVSGICNVNEGCSYGGTEGSNIPICSAASSFILEFYDGVETDGPTNAVWTTFEFTDSEGVSVIDVLESACEAIFAGLDFANALLIAFREVPAVGQILSAGTMAAEDVVRGTCAAIDGVAKGIEAGD